MKSRLSLLAVVGSLLVSLAVVGEAVAAPKDKEDDKPEAGKMDCLTFIAKLVEHAVWPLCVLVVTGLFKKEISELLGRMEKLKSGSLEAEFTTKAKVAEARAEGRAEAKVEGESLNQTSKSETTLSKTAIPNHPANQFLSHIKYLFALSGQGKSRDLVIAGWADVQGAIRHTLVPRSITEISPVDDYADYLPSNLQRTYRELWELNSVARTPSTFELIPKDGARSFLRTAELLIGELALIPPANRPSGSQL